MINNLEKNEEVFVEKFNLNGKYSPKNFVLLNDIILTFLNEVTFR